LKANLVRTLATEVNKELRIQAHPAAWLSVQLHHPAIDAIGIELSIPGRVERVGEVHSPTVAADLHHLRRSV